MKNRRSKEDEEAKYKSGFLVKLATADLSKAQVGLANQTCHL
jgi:hypothetical protein